MTTDEVQRSNQASNPDSDGEPTEDRLLTDDGDQEPIVLGQLPDPAEPEQSANPYPPPEPSTAAGRPATPVKPVPVADTSATDTTSEEAQTTTAAGVPGLTEDLPRLSEHDDDSGRADDDEIVDAEIFDAEMFVAGFEGQEPNGSGPAPADLSGSAAASSATATDETTADLSATTHLEMRQVAGLTAGSMMKLAVGRAFEFNESNEGGSFSLRVLEGGDVVVHPGSAKAVLDEVEVTEPMLVGDAMLNVSSACFSIRRPRPPVSSETRMDTIGAAFASIPAITVPLLLDEPPMPPDEIMGSRLGTLINRNPLTRGAVGRDAWNFLQEIRSARSVVADRHRLVHPDPEELKTRLSRLDPGLWERNRSHALFGRFAVGYATVPWEPRFDNPELIPEILHEPIVEMSLLPWVPVTANLEYGPLGIVGRRAARLAACRHAILSLAALSGPGEIGFAIRAGRNASAGWNWTRALPPLMAGSADRYTVTVFDTGEDNGAAAADVDIDLTLEGSPADTTAELPMLDDGDHTIDGLDDLVIIDDSTTTGGSIVLAESVDDLDRQCGTILQIEPNGTGSVTNHLNETIQVTPIGVTEAFAHDMATRIADILTNSFL